MCDIFSAFVPKTNCGLKTKNKKKMFVFLPHIARCEGERPQKYEADCPTSGSCTSDGKASLT